ncbi:uncharacterized protein K444DRAFT_651842 [Hyaloscypha bicolor E]|uniref:Amino acid permease/ SLC12A domain-containing protein n=1 Tax=Hyaloscypha bicolor E TaxID=1095630 RepID=A0A2J6TJ25_9HELO|nr:uncharacterized protein K444DRAFT_651842 [Hyaloscypha bicolor E]PMD63005.1 hypothetical protein K444DRAFT_651842 [Hyaloscypha bicolor E]
MSYAIVYSGPVGAILRFFIVGVDVYFVMQSMWALNTFFCREFWPMIYLMSGRFVDPALAFALAGEYNSFSIVMTLWTDRVPDYGWILMAWAFFQTTSLLGVAMYGEMEFWLAFFKFLFLALTAGESANPKRDLPKAIKQTFCSIIVPANSLGLLTATSKSGAGNLINVVIITALLTSVNSSIYICSRSLLSLAKLGRAPKSLRRRLPTDFLGLLALLNYTVDAGKVFTYLVDIRGAATFVAWAFIAQGLDLNVIPYRALWYPYGAWFVLFISIFLVLTSGYTTLIPSFHAVNFVFNYIVLVIFVLLFISWKLHKKMKCLPLMEMNLATGRTPETSQRHVSQAGRRVFMGHASNLTGFVCSNCFIY